MQTMALLALDDARFMAAAIRLSQRHVGLTGTNPSVGALLVQGAGTPQARIVGRGVTAPGGRPHAEVVALAEAGPLAAGATAYVTLEPCSHHGHTPPCSAALVRAGVARVVSALRDPDPRVDGRGFAMLEAAGITIRTGVAAAEAAQPLAGFLARQRLGRPLLTVKLAHSADGGIAAAGYVQAAITGAVANAQTHLERARADAILVGVGTVRSDDPALTCRLPGLEGRSPMRVVYDPALHMPQGARLVLTARDVPTVIAVAKTLPQETTVPFERMGCRILRVPHGAGGPAGLLTALYALGVSSVLFEAGARFGRTVLDAGLADRIICVRGERPLGEGRVASPLAAAHLRQMRLCRDMILGADRWQEYERTDPVCSPGS